MNFQNIAKSRLSLLTLSVWLLLSCKNDAEKERQTSLDMVTVRTLGLAYLEENKLPEAEEQFLQLVQIAPDEALGYANLGLVYMRMGKYSAAEEQIKKAIAVEPNDPDIRLNLAEIYELDNRREEATKVLEKIVKNSPDHIKSLYKLAQFYRNSGDPERRLRAQELLTRVVDALPANIAMRLQLIEVLLRNGQADQARMHMEKLRQQMPELPKESVAFFEKGLALTASSKPEQALAPAMIFHNFMKVTPLYQSGILDIKGAGGPLLGSPILTFSRDISLQTQVESILETMRFTDATATAGLDVVKETRQPELQNSLQPHCILAVADYEGDSDIDVYASIWDARANASQQFLFRNDFGRFQDVSAEAGIKHPGHDLAAVFADYDNDGYLDLYVVNSERNLLYKNVELGKFQNVAAAAGVADISVAFEAVFADFDHDADLDLYLANAGGNRLYRNNSDGTFTERSGEMGIGGAKTRSRDAVIGDFDEDGDLDLFVVNEDASNVLYTNLRQGHFEDITQAAGLKRIDHSGAAAVGDYNNDGFLDLFVTALENGRHDLFKNKGDGTFERDTHSSQTFSALRDFIGLDTRFFDFDNDGFMDLLVAGKPPGDGSGLRLFHNDGTGKFTHVPALLPDDIAAVGKIAVADYNEDGDLDIFLAELNGGIRLLRNDGGNVNKYLKVKLRGLRTGSGKNNYFGIGAKLEVRAGDLYQMRLITEPVTHLGLGQRLKADVVRIVWPNGVPQNLFYPGSDQDLVEEQTLKGSCAFLYTWNGQEYHFVTDVMWRSALGMPLGIMGGETAYAFANSSQDYFRIPGEALKAQDGKYRLQITEELWETAYFDKVRLLAVDHPDSVDVFIDERFIPPPVPPLTIYAVSEHRVPVSAVDDRGNDLLPEIRHKDDIYISNLIPGPYQGLTEIHDLILDLGDLSVQQHVTLFLNGWTFPTDASINVALSQSNQVKVVPPFLQVKDRTGAWQTVVESMSFPMGKDKTVIVDLNGKFLSKHCQVRIRTNMQVYWDHVFFAIGEPDIAIRNTTLKPTFADLHYRGFSRLYRKGSRYGPHWFEYSDVSTEQKWRDLIGNYTRYGDVLPLLLQSDDKYVIMNAGDEITLEFDAEQAPELPPGWSRDFLIYTDGWIKDGDLNTAHGKTVAPLPYHGMSRYPYGPEEGYPDTEEYRAYLRNYNTRKVTTERFGKQLSNQSD